MTCAPPPVSGTSCHDVRTTAFVRQAQGGRLAAVVVKDHADLSRCRARGGAETRWTPLYDDHSPLPSVLSRPPTRIRRPGKQVLAKPRRGANPNRRRQGRALYSAAALSRSRCSARTIENARHVASQGQLGGEDRTLRAPSPVDSFFQVTGASGRARPGDLTISPRFALKRRDQRWWVPAVGRAGRRGLLPSSSTIRTPTRSTFSWDLISRSPWFTQLEAFALQRMVRHDL